MSQISLIFVMIELELYISKMFFHDFLAQERCICGVWILNPKKQTLRIL